MKGFTLLELLIVVAILGIIAAVGMPVYQNYAQSAEASVAQNNLRAIHSHQEEYFSRNGAYYTTAACPATAGTSADIIKTNIDDNLFFGDQFIQNDTVYIYCIDDDTGAAPIVNYTAKAEGGATDLQIDETGATNF